MAAGPRIILILPPGEGATSYLGKNIPLTVKKELQNKASSRLDVGDIESWDLTQDVALDGETMQEFSESENEEEETENKQNEEIPAFSLQELCRICAQPGENMEAVFGAQQLHSKINLCLPINVRESDRLPLNVCRSCVARLELTHELATECEKSDILLRYMLQQQQEFDMGDNFLDKSDDEDVAQPAYNSDTCTLAMSVDYVDDVNTTLETENTTEKHAMKNKTRLKSCRYCTQKYQDPKLLELHISECHTYLCSLCDVNIQGNSVGVLEKHIATVHSSCDVNTQGNSITISQKQAKTMHSRAESDEFEYLTVFPVKPPQFKCKKCCNSYSDAQQLEKHICYTHFICIKCNGRFLNADKFKTHFCIPKLSCADCGKSFNRKKKLCAHFCKNGYICKYCKRKLGNKFKLQLHSCRILRKLNKNKVPRAVVKFTCVNCSENFATLDKYEEHYIKYAKYLCTLCFKIYKTENGLNVHPCVRATKRNFIRNIEKNPTCLTCTEKPKKSRNITKKCKLDKNVTKNDNRDVGPTSQAFIRGNTSSVQYIAGTNAFTDPTFIHGNTSSVQNIAGTKSDAFTNPTFIRDNTSSVQNIAGTKSDAFTDPTFIHGNTSSVQNIAGTKSFTDPTFIRGNTSSVQNIAGTKSDVFTDPTFIRDNTSSVQNIAGTNAFTDPTFIRGNTSSVQNIAGTNAFTDPTFIHGNTSSVQNIAGTGAYFDVAGEIPSAVNEIIVDTLSHINNSLPLVLEVANETTVDTTSHVVALITCGVCLHVFDARQNHECAILNKEAKVAEKVKTPNVVNTVKTPNVVEKAKTPNVVEKAKTPISYGCNICKEIFKQKYLLKNHLKNVHCLFLCVNMNCFQYFESKTAANTHKRLTHTPIRLCTTCGKSFLCPTRYKDHIYYEHQGGENKFKCAHCDLSYRHRQRIVNHIVSKHLTDKRTCEYCTKIFNCAYELRLHIYERHKEKKHLCAECGLGFTYTHDLVAHTNLKHVNYLCYVCKICKLEFKSAGDVNTHVNTHSMVEIGALQSQICYSIQSPYQCNICKNYCKNEPALYQHINNKHKLTRRKYDALTEEELETHRENAAKPFVTPQRKADISYKFFTKAPCIPQKCPICDKVCKNKSGLQIHINTIHNDKESSFKCGVCDKSFATFLQMKSHEKYHNKGHIYVCSACGVEFTNKHEIHRHVKFLHGTKF